MLLATAGGDAWVVEGPNARLGAAQPPHPVIFVGDMDAFRLTVLANRMIETYLTKSMQGRGGVVRRDGVRMGVV